MAVQFWRESRLTKKSSPGWLDRSPVVVVCLWARHLLILLLLTVPDELVIALCGWRHCLFNNTSVNGYSGWTRSHGGLASILPERARGREPGCGTNVLVGRCTFLPCVSSTTGVINGPPLYKLLITRFSLRNHKQRIGRGGWLNEGKWGIITFTWFFVMYWFNNILLVNAKLCFLGSRLRCSILCRVR